MIDWGKRIADAEAREKNLRDAAWLNLDADIAGLTVRQMTVRDYICLDAVDSPLLFGADPTAAELAQFLWILAPEFSEDSGARMRFTERVAVLPYIETVKGCRELIDTTFLDAPAGAGKGSGEPSYYSWLTSLIDTLASEYGWKHFEILDMPLRQVFQLVRAIRKRRDPKAALFNPLSDRAKCDWLEALNSEKAVTA